MRARPVLEPRDAVPLRGQKAGPHNSGIVRATKNRTCMMIVIPRPFVRLLKWQPRDRLLISARGKRLVVESIEDTMSERLAAQLVDGTLDENTID